MRREEPKKRWFGFKPLVVLASVLEAGTAIFCLVISKTHERQEFPGADSEFVRERRL